MRRAWRMEKAGRLSDLVLKEEALAAPGEKEVRVAVKAIGLNFADIFAVIGLYGATPKGSFVPGLEYSGTVGLRRCRKGGCRGRSCSFACCCWARWTRLARA